MREEGAAKASDLHSRVLFQRILSQAVGSTKVASCGVDKDTSSAECDVVRLGCFAEVVVHLELSPAAVVAGGAEKGSCFADLPDVIRFDG